MKPTKKKITKLKIQEVIKPTKKKITKLKIQEVIKEELEVFVDGNLNIQDIEELEVKQNNHKNFNLIVKSPFKNYVRGNCINNSEEIDSILGCHEKSMVIKNYNK